MPSFEDYREGPAAPWWVKWAFLAFLAAAALAGCAPAPYRPALPHPTPAEISALAAVRATGRGPEAPFQVVVEPSIILQGGAAWVRCLVPRSYGPGRRQLAIEGLFASDRPLDSIEYKYLVEHAPCGQHVVVCQIRTARGEEQRTATLEVRGGMCESGGPGERLEDLFRTYVDGSALVLDGDHRPLIQVDGQHSGHGPRAGLEPGAGHHRRHDGQRGAFHRGSSIHDSGPPHTTRSPGRPIPRGR